MKYSLEVKREGADWQPWTKDDTFDNILDEFFYLQRQSHDFQEMRIHWIRPDDL